MSLQKQDSRQMVCVRICACTRTRARCVCVIIYAFSDVIYSVHFYDVEIVLIIEEVVVTFERILLCNREQFRKHNLKRIRTRYDDDNY